MGLLKRKCYITTDLGQAMSLTYILRHEKGGYVISIKSTRGRIEEIVSTEILNLGIFSALQFYRMLIKDRVTPVTLQDILEDLQRR